MDRTAGFAASVTIREEVFRSFIRVLYNAGKISPSLSLSGPGLIASLFMDLPDLRISGVTDGHFVIELLSWGPMTVIPPGFPAESRKVKFRTTIQVPPSVFLIGGKILVTFLTPSATIQSYEIDPYAGGAFSAATTAFLNSPEFVAGLTEGLRTKLRDISEEIPKFDAAFLGALATHSSAQITAVPVDEALAMGIDVDFPKNDELDRPAVKTVGDLTRLVDVSAGYDIATWTNPRVVRHANEAVELETQKTVLEAGALLRGFDMKVEEGWFRISGSGVRPEGIAQFSLKAVPQLIRPGVTLEWDEQFGEHFVYTTPDREELWFDPQDVSVDIDRDWAVVVLEGVLLLFFAGFGTLVVEIIIGMIRGNIVRQIGQDGEAQADRNQEFTIEGVTRPPVRLRIETFECHAEGVFTAMTITPKFWAASFEGPTTLGGEEAFQSGVRFKIGLPPDVLVQDPELRVAWAVRRTDTNEILVARDTTAAAGGLEIKLDKNQIPFLTVSELGVEVRVYRRLGVGATEIFFKQQFMRMVDYVDRSHPFVRWQHDASVPRVTVESNGTQTLHGYQITHRLSRIHRTAIPGRCRMLRNLSVWRLIPPGSVDPYPLEYLDALPFDVTDLPARRGQVCDYCFFGGPDKDVPLI